MVWMGMRKRGVDLPVEGEEADILWSTFLKASVSPTDHDGSHNALFEEILEYASDLKRRTGTQYRGLYKCVIEPWLLVKPGAVIAVHNHLMNHFGEELYFDLRDMVDGFYPLKRDNRVWKAFRAIYRSVKQDNLYDHLIPTVLERGGVEAALRFHQLLLTKGDGPSQEIFSLPGVQALFDRDDDTSLPMIHNGRSTKPSSPGTKSLYPTINRATMSTVVGEVHGIKPKEISDTFVAKMFATKAFPLEMIINGLAFIGVDNIGPLALREMALRTRSNVEFCFRLQDLESARVTGNSVYSRLLVKVANEDASLYKTLLASDQHPEAFEDVRTQESLLESFLKQKEWANAHVTLTALSLHGSFANTRGWNMLLQMYILDRNYAAIEDIVKQMQTSRLALTKRTLSFLHRLILHERTRSKAPVQLPSYMSEARPLQFTTNCYIYAARRGVVVNPKLWIENLKRYGMRQQWDELERLVIWLVDFYAKRCTKVKAQTGGREVKVNPVLDVIFTDQMRMAIIAWGFRTASLKFLLSTRRHSRKPALNEKNEPESGNPQEEKSESSLENCRDREDEHNSVVDPSTGVADISCEPWANGIALLKILNDREVHGFALRTKLSVIRRGLLLRMWMLFGPAYSRKRVNRTTMLVNKIKLGHYVKHANEIWGGQLFNLNPELYEKENFPQLLTALFGKHRRVRKAPDQPTEYADVVGYARALESGRKLRLPRQRSGRYRKLHWLDSPFRMVAKS
jgi:hypothetical protein